jgi:hypothetical protein
MALAAVGDSGLSPRPEGPMPEARAGVVAPEAVADTDCGVRGDAGRGDDRLMLRLGRERGVAGVRGAVVDWIEVSK